MLGSLILVFALCTDHLCGQPCIGSQPGPCGPGKGSFVKRYMQRMPGAGPGAGKRYKLCPAGDVTRIICFVSLFLLGFIKFLDYSIKAYINRHCCIRRNLSFSPPGLKVIVNIYGDPMAADVDGSQSLGWKETVFLALAMSIDSLVAGTMAALLDIPVAATLALVICGGSMYDVRRPVAGAQGGLTLPVRPVLD